MAFGEKGEDWLVECLEKGGLECAKVDEKHFDIVLKQSNLKIEVKSDRNALATGNILFEIWSCWRLRSLGWAQSSTCDILCYLLYGDDGNVGEILFYDFLSLKANILWTAMAGSWYNKPTEGKFVSSRNNKGVRNLILPKKYCEKFEVQFEKGKGFVPKAISTSEKMGDGNCQCECGLEVDSLTKSDSLN